MGSISEPATDAEEGLSTDEVDGITPDIVDVFSNGAIGPTKYVDELSLAIVVDCLIVNG